MKLTYDSNLRVAGIGVAPWTRLGPELWLSNYVIASLSGWDLDPKPALPKIYSLDTKSSSEAMTKNTQSLIQNKHFQNILQRQLPEYDFITYKPVRVPPELSGRKFLMNEPKFTEHYENKALFRNKMKHAVTFPTFQIYDRDKLESSTTAYEQMMAGRSKVVLQDEQLSGGKGTFIIGSYEQYCLALDSLRQSSRHKKVVVSDMIEGARERSLQACITKYGVFIGPLQRQVVANPLLANLSIAMGDKFCGAAISKADQNTLIHKEATQIVRKIAADLQKDGYRGIFGVDFLLDKTDKLYTIEVNPRITGVTPLLSALFSDQAGIPFYLFHLLELGGYEYSIIDETANFDRDGGLLVLHSLENTTTTVSRVPHSGTYELETSGKLRFVSDNIKLDTLVERQFVIQAYVAPNEVVKPGARLALLFFKTQILDEETDKLYNNTAIIIESVRQAISQIAC
ncbi:MAG: ATP-grasp domain-containing protein [Candidatus Saccharimonadales bacterium]